MRTQERHSPIPDVLKQIASGSPIAYAIEGSPDCQVRILTDQAEIEVLVKGDQSDPLVKALHNLKSDVRHLDGAEWRSISVTWQSSPIEAYLFCCAIVDRVQIDRLSLAEAVEIVIHEMRDLMRREQALTREREVGLFGELVVLSSVLRALPTPLAIESWVGDRGEEHDFVLPGTDLEVKTTTSEERAHWISSLSQLRPLEGRPLQLVSIQITPKVGAGARTLPDLAELVIASAGAWGSRVNERLERQGLFTTDSDLYPTSWALRSQIFAYHVNAEFPCITDVQLKVLGLESSAITDVRYRLNLKGLASLDEPPVHFEASLEEI